MSDENTPKLRLRPKLAGEPSAITPAPETPPAEAAQAPVAAPAEPAVVPLSTKPTILRPKLALKAESAVQAADEPIISSAAPLPEPTATPQDPQSFPPPPPKQLLATPSRLKPASNPVEAGNPSESTGATPPFPVNAPKGKFPVMLDAPPPPRIKVAPPTQETWPAVLDAPPPLGLSPAIAPLKAEEEPAEITAIRKASTFPFPSPTAKFPPLPGISSSPSEESAPPEPLAEGGQLKKVLLIGVLVLLLMASVAFAYFKFFAKLSFKSTAAPAPVPTAAPAVVPVPVPAPIPAPKRDSLDKIRAAVDKIQQEQNAPVNGVMDTDPKAESATPNGAIPVTEAGPAQPADTATVQPEAAPLPPAAVKPPPPAPSLAFKAWVINLKIRGVRGGESPHVFIDRTNYVPGDMVNQELGIFFVGYDEGTRMLIFQDKTGATFERRP